MNRGLTNFAETLKQCLTNFVFSLSALFLGNSEAICTSELTERSKTLIDSGSICSYFLMVPSLSDSSPSIFFTLQSFGMPSGKRDRFTIPYSFGYELTQFPCDVVRILGSDDILNFTTTKGH